MSKEPLVSIVIPTHNRADLLRRAIQSAINQTYKNIEVIVVDDGCEDNTKEVVADIRDSRITYLRHPSPKGAPAARNTGIKAAGGEYINVLDDDDELLPGKIAKQIHLFGRAEKNTGVVYCGYTFVRNHVKIQTVLPKFKGDVYLHCLRKTLSASNTFLIKKEYYLNAGLWDEALIGAQDFDMWVRISKFCHFDYISEPLAVVNLHGNRITCQLTQKIKARTDLINKYDAEFKKNPGIFSVHLRNLYWNHYLAGNTKIAFQYLMRAMINAPLRLKFYINLAMFLLPQEIHKTLLRKYFIRNYGGIISY